MVCLVIHIYDAVNNYVTLPDSKRSAGQMVYVVEQYQSGNLNIPD